MKENRCFSSLTDKQMALARAFERAGLTSISQAVKAFERRDNAQIEVWKEALTKSFIGSKDYYSAVFGPNIGADGIYRHITSRFTELVDWNGRTHLYINRPEQNCVCGIIFGPFGRLEDAYIADEAVYYERHIRLLSMLLCHVLDIQMPEGYEPEPHERNYYEEYFLRSEVFVRLLDHASPDPDAVESNHHAI